MELTGEALRAAIEPVAAEHNVGLVAVVRRLSDGGSAAAWVGADAAGNSLDTRTIFPVASVTKLATALTVHRLVQGGLLRYRDPIGTYMAYPVGAQITVAQLLSHTSGLPTNAVEIREGDTWESLRPRLLAVPPEFEPGTRMLYSNVAYCVQGALIEDVTGARFAEVVRAEVLEPLNMRASTIGEEPRSEPVRLDGHTGYNHPWMPAVGLPSSGLYAPAWDVLKLIQAFSGDPVNYLLPEIAAGALGDQTVGTENPEAQVCARGPWGLGPELLGDKNGRPHVPRSAGHCSFGHIGSSGCIAWLSPACGVAWVILSSRTITEDQWNEPAWRKVGEAVIDMPI